MTFVDNRSAIAGKRIAFAGKLGGMNRREAANLLRSFGAAIVELHHPTIDWVVIGAEEPPLAENRLLEPLHRDLAAAGHLEIFHETELWQRLGLVEHDRHLRSLYTPAMLADLLNVSVRIIRRWHRRGLIVPARTMHNLPYFDFQEVATARRLAELVASGASPLAIEARLRALALRLPDVSRPLAQLSVLVEGRQILLRQGEGLVETDGQLRFDFTDAVEANALDELERSVISFSSARPEQVDDARGQSNEVDEWLAEVFDLEEQGRLSDAIDLCHAILARDGIRADLCFQLAELLYRDGQAEAARERYYAAIELDESFVEARVALGCLLAESDRYELAIAALRGALSLHDEYADAHYHLAQCLEATGDNQAAHGHWLRFRELAPHSPWTHEP